jgi:hypothetical protein
VRHNYHQSFDHQGDAVTEGETLPTTPPLQEPAPHPESVVHRPLTPIETTPVVSGIIADPWLRFFARSVDIHIGMILMAFVVGILLPSLLGSALFTS